MNSRFNWRRIRPPDSPEQTVASVIDSYQTFAKQNLAASTLEVRLPYQQSFAEAHGWRLISKAKSLHMLSWLHAHPTWKSDWTKSSALRHVQVGFNWAVNVDLIPHNRFAKIKHTVGEPRRNLTEAEFQAILRASNSGPRRTKPTPAARFKQVLMFLRYTGARPQEAAHLRWENIDWANSRIVLHQHKTTRTQKRKNLE